MSFLATTGGITGGDVRDLMLAAIEHRFGLVNRLTVAIEWLSDNGSCYIAGETCGFARRSGWSRGRQSKARRATEWPKLSFALSNGITSASVVVPMQRPSCASYRAGLPTTTRFTRTKLSDIVPLIASVASCSSSRSRSVPLSTPLPADSRMSTRMQLIRCILLRVEP
jgi:hypothetical protein